MPDFGEELARIRGSKKLSKAELARRSGISVATLGRAESSATCELSANTMILLLKALASSKPALTSSEAIFLGSAAGLSTNVSLTFVQQGTPADDAELLNMRMSEVMSLIGPTATLKFVGSFLDAIKSIHPPSANRARAFIVKQPPVQKDGYVEEVETEYVEPEPDPNPHEAVSKRPRATHESS